MTDIKFPGNTYAPHATDLAAPTAELLRALGLLEAANATATLGGTPESVQVIRAGATTLSKVTTGLLAAGGVAATWLSYVQLEWQAAGETVRVAGLIGLALIIAAVAFGIAMIVRADVLGRSQATAARIEAQGVLASRFLALTSTQQLERSSAEPTAPNGSVATLTMQVAGP